MTVKAARGGRQRGDTMKLVTKAALVSLALIGPAQAADLFGAAPRELPGLPGADRDRDRLQLVSARRHRRELRRRTDRRLCAGLRPAAGRGRPSPRRRGGTERASHNFRRRSRLRLSLQRLYPPRRDLGLPYGGGPEPLSDRRLPLRALRRDEPDDRLSARLSLQSLRHLRRDHERAPARQHSSRQRLC